MKKVILTAVIGLLSLMSFAQFQWDDTIGLSDSLKHKLETRYHGLLVEIDINHDYFIYAEEAKAHKIFNLGKSPKDTFFLDLITISYFESMEEITLNYVKVTAGFEELLTFNQQLTKLRLRGAYQEGKLDLSVFSNLTFLDLRDNPKLDTVCVHPNLVGNSNFLIGVGTNTKVFTNNCQTEVYVCQNRLEYTKCPDPLSITETQSTEKAQILKAYNLQGQEVPVNTKGEVIILLYDNGTREKTYVAE